MSKFSLSISHPLQFLFSVLQVLNTVLYILVFLSFEVTLLPFNKGSLFLSPKKINKI